MALLTNANSTVATSLKMPALNLAPSPAMAKPKPLGIKAASPNANVTAPPNTIKPAMVQPPVAQPTQQSTQGGVQGGLTAPNGGQPLNAPTTPQTSPTLPPGGLYGQIINNLATKANSTGSDYQAQIDHANKVNEQLAQSKKNEAISLANNAGMPQPLNIQQGQDQILRNQYLMQQNALAAEYQGATNQLGAANTQQGLQQSGLQAAGQLAAPQNIQYGTQYIDPTTGQNIQGPGGDPAFQGALQTYAQALANNQPGAIPSGIMSNPVLAAQVLNAAKAINPSFNYNTAVGAAGAQQSNAQIGGTAGVAANNAVFQQAYGEYNQLLNSIGNIDQFGTLLTQTMQQGGINPSDARFANQTIANVRRQLSNQQQAVFDNTLATLKARVASLLATGGAQTPTEITHDASAILDDSQPIGTLNAVLSRIAAEGNVLLENKRKIANDAYRGTQTGAAGNTANSGGGDLSLYNF